MSVEVGALMDGVGELFGNPGRGLSANGEKVPGVIPGAGDINAETVVLAAGPWAPGLLTGTGIDLGLRLHTLELSVLRRPPEMAGLTTAVTHAPSGLVARCDSGPFCVAVAYPANPVQPQFPQDPPVPPAPHSRFP